MYSDMCRRDGQVHKGDSLHSNAVGLVALQLFVNALCNPPAPRVNGSMQGAGGYT